jgi:peptide subunit release factor 1 (eRF1)
LLKTPSGGDYSTVLEQAIDTFVEAERAESRDTVSRLHEQIRRGGLAVVGVDHCRDAILGGYAAELVISEELPKAGREELTRLATARDLAIEVCEGDELLATHGGVGCLLRYRPEFLPEQAVAV